METTASGERRGQEEARYAGTPDRQVVTLTNSDQANPDHPWIPPFPPERPVRSYMMDVDPSDVVELPDRSALAALRDVAMPLERIPAEAWEPHPGLSEPPRAGVVMLYNLIVTGEVNPGGRTPCREEHSVIVHIQSQGPRAPVVVCPLETWEDHTHYRKALQTEQALRMAQAGQTWGLLPVLLPRDGFDREPWAFIDLSAPKAVPYRHVARFGQPKEGSLRLVEAFGPRLAATFGQLMASIRPR